MPYFSIIIPTYNSSKTIRECLDSVLNQTFVDFELLIMDGESTDNTLEIIREYRDNRVLINSEPDNGIYDAMNKGIDISRGGWIYFLGSDDTFYKNTTLDKVFSFSSVGGLDVLYGNVYSPIHGGVYNGEWSIEKIGYNLCHQAIFYKRTIFKLLGNFNLKYKVLADHDFNIKWLLNKTCKHKFIDVLIANYSGDGFSSKFIDIEFEKDILFLILIRGYRILNNEELKEYISQYSIQCRNNKKYMLNASLKILIYFLRVINYIKRLINQILNKNTRTDD